VKRFSVAFAVLLAWGMTGLSGAGFRLLAAEIRDDFDSTHPTRVWALTNVWHSTNGPQGGELAGYGSRAVSDLLNHFWKGGTVDGQIVPTWNGYGTNLPDARGALWERATLYHTLYDAWRFTGSESIRARLEADWKRTRTAYTAAQLEACGADSGTNWASDDAGWSALMYVMAYRASGDPAALARAKGLLSHVYSRWLDDVHGGGLWYSDERKEKSLYQVAIVLASLWVSEAAGDRELFDRALQCYTWMEGHLLREDGLYWEGYGASGPVGKDHPASIGEGGSVVFLGGNLGMGALHGVLYRTTGEAMYRRRALRTAEAVRLHLTSATGCYLNDRDAWTEGTFAGEWVREVLSLKGIPSEDVAVLTRTALSIARKARTDDGYYGASWDGPAEGAGSVWWRKNSKPQQIMTSANSAHLIIAAAAPFLRGAE
jgi:hypothetical protein